MVVSSPRRSSEFWRRSCASRHISRNSLHRAAGAALFRCSSSITGATRRHVEAPISSPCLWRTIARVSSYAAALSPNSSNTSMAARRTALSSRKQPPKTGCEVSLAGCWAAKALSWWHGSDLLNPLVRLPLQHAQLAAVSRCIWQSVPSRCPDCVVCTGRRSHV